MMFEITKDDIAQLATANTSCHPADVVLALTSAGYQVEAYMTAGRPRPIALTQEDTNHYASKLGLDYEEGVPDEVFEALTGDLPKITDEYGQDREPADESDPVIVTATVAIDRDSHAPVPMSLGGEADKSPFWFDNETCEVLLGYVPNGRGGCWSLIRTEGARYIIKYESEAGVIWAEVELENGIRLPRLVLSLVYEALGENYGEISISDPLIEVLVKARNLISVVERQNLAPIDAEQIAAALGEVLRYNVMRDVRDLRGAFLMRAIRNDDGLSVLTVAERAGLSSSVVSSLVGPTRR